MCETKRNRKRKQVKYILICFRNQERGNEQEELFFFLQDDFELERVKREEQKCVEWVMGVGRVIDGVDI